MLFVGLMVLLIVGLMVLPSVGMHFFCLVRLAVLLFVGSVLCRMCCLLVGAALSGSRFLRGSVAVACPRLYAAFATEEKYPMSRALRRVLWESPCLITACAACTYQRHAVPLVIRRGATFAVDFAQTWRKNKWQGCVDKTTSRDACRVQGPWRSTVRGFRLGYSCLGSIDEGQFRPRVC